MPRRARATVAGEWYHVTARGNGDDMIFSASEEKQTLLRLLGKATVGEAWDVMAYCVMDNHYHLVLRTPLEGLSHGMHRVNSSYGSLYNAHRGRRGHVFQGRFFSVALVSDAHLLEACRYVVLNPVRAGLAGSPAGWRWSSYGASVNGTKGPIPLADKMLLSMLDSRGEPESRRAYAGFVEAGVGAAKPTFLQRPHEGWNARGPDGRHQARFAKDSAELVVDAWRLRREGKPLREIAGELGVSAMTVARYLKRKDAASRSDEGM